MKGQQQSDRLAMQQKAAEGVIGIFDAEAQEHAKRFLIIQKSPCASFKKNFRH